MQKNSHAAPDWFPKSTVECIGLMLNPKTNANLCPLPAWFPKKYDDQIRSAANMENQTAAASDLIGCKNRIAIEIEGYIFYDIDTDECVTDLLFSRHI